MSYVKFCPRCQTTVAVDAAICPNCGHQFRTHFQPPISEKTIAMTPATEADLPAGKARTYPEDPERPAIRPRTILLGVIVLAALGIGYGVVSRHARENTSPKNRPALTQAFQPYAVTVTSVGTTSVPVATQSPADLQQWNASQSHTSPIGNAAVGDDPAHVHLYISKRIVLVAAGTPARVLLEQGTTRRIQILGGAYQGKTGYISQAHIERTSSASSRQN